MLILQWKFKALLYDGSYSDRVTVDTAHKLFLELTDFFDVTGERTQVGQAIQWQINTDVYGLRIIGNSRDDQTVLVTLTING